MFLREERRLVDAFPALKRLGERLRARPIEFVQQTTVTDCGAACLAMVLNYFGREVTLDEIRRALGTARDGVSAQAMLDVASSHGLLGRGVRLELADLGRLPRAAILHWNLSHFVVFDRVAENALVVVDPSFGERRVEWQDVSRFFTGVALAFERSESFIERKTGANPVLRQLKTTLAGSDDWHKIVTASVLLQIISLFLPMIHGRLVDRVVPRNDQHLLTVLLAALGSLLLFHFLASMTRAQLMLQLRTRFDARMTFGFMDHLLRLPYAFFEQRQVGDLQMRVATVANIREVLTGTLLSAMVDGTMAFFHLLFLVLVSPRVTLVALAVFSVQVVVYLVTRRRLRSLATGLLAKQAEAANALNELLSGIESLKASGCEQRGSASWAARYVDVMNVSLSQGSVQTFAQSGLSSLGLLGPIVLLIAGIAEVMDHHMTLGAMLSANGLATGFLQPTMSLVVALQSLLTARAQLARLDDVIETPTESPLVRQRIVPRLSGRITLEDVTFTYAPGQRPAVQNVSLNIGPGEFVAVVGRSGSGKTTLGRLLLGLYAPSTGVVRFDGLALSSLDLPAIRRQMGVVLQKPHVFGTSVRANIALADPDVPLEVVERAAQRACIDEEIRQMPLQYDTPIVAGGASLSGGQRQRIALARALLNEPVILLLDEATSALDSLTEQAVQRQLAEVSCTRVVIAHRLSTVIAADRILVMDAGRIVEEGKHAELMARGGTYSELVAAQLADGAGVRRYCARTDSPLSILGAPQALLVAAHGASQGNNGSGEQAGSRAEPRLIDEGWGASGKTP